MAAGYRSYFAFWVGGMSAYAGVVSTQSTYLVGEINIYPVLDGIPNMLMPTMIYPTFPFWEGRASSQPLAF